jgi:two-component system chemotaxis response regulator CheB
MSALKILIVEDSEIASDILTQALQSDSKLQVVGIARNGREALELVPRLKPDLITMDVWMPVMDGFETVERIMATHPTPILVITSSSLKEDVQLSMRMLEAGALDVMEKPSLNDENQWAYQQRELVSRVKLLAGVKVITHLRGRRNYGQSQSLPSSSKNSDPIPPGQPKSQILPFNNSKAPKSTETSQSQVTANKTEAKPVTEAVSPFRPTPHHNSAEPIKATFPTEPYYRVIAIASSTGGPTALLRILQALPLNLPCGIMIVQHISDGFTQGLVDWLQRETSLKIKMAQNGDRVLPAQVLIAPDGRDMVVNSNYQIATLKDSQNLLCPSADVMMRSVAQVYGAQAIGIVLTGMGNDGASGLLAMSKAGAYTLAQDEASSLIYGMPKAARDNGATREIINLGNIANRLVQLLQQPLEDGQRYSGGTRL